MPDIRLGCSDDYYIEELVNLFPGWRDRPPLKVDESRRHVMLSSPWFPSITFVLYEKAFNYLREISATTIDCGSDVCINFSEEGDYYYITSGSIIYILDLRRSSGDDNFRRYYNLGLRDISQLSVYGKDNIIYTVINVNDEETSQTIDYIKKYHCDLHLVKVDATSGDVISQKAICKSAKFLRSFQSDYGMFIFHFDSNVLYIYYQKTSILRTITIQPESPTGSLEEFKILSDNILLVKIDSCFYLYYIDRQYLAIVGRYDYSQYSVAMDKFIIFHNQCEIKVVCTLTGIELLYNRPDNPWFICIDRLFSICIENSLIVIDTHDDSYDITCIDLNFFDEEYIDDDPDYKLCCVKDLVVQHNHLTERYSMLYCQALPWDFSTWPRWFGRGCLVMCLYKVGLICEVAEGADDAMAIEEVIGLSPYLPPELWKGIVIWL